MPKDSYCEFLEPKFFLEWRGIRGGERGDRMPTKTPLRVRMPMRNPSTRKFDIDIDLMTAAAVSEGLGPSDWAKSTSIPVYATTDKILGDGGIVYVERALYTGSGRLCGSAAREEMALQKADVQAYAKSKLVKLYPEPKTVVCSPECPMWRDHRSGEKSDCGWRAVVSLQLKDRPVFPSTAVFRSRGYYTILAIISSLQAISSVTGGIIAGIPLKLRQHQKEVRAADGAIRKIPVVSVDFDGTLQELRAFAAEELRSRSLLARAHDGEFVTDSGGGVFGVNVFSPAVDEVDNVATSDAGDDDEEDVGGEDGGVVDLKIRAVQDEVARLGMRLGYTGARMRSLEAKHGGDLQAMLVDLRAESGVSAGDDDNGNVSSPAAAGSGSWGPGDVGDDYLGADDLEF